jgi:hypothetical protein
MKSLIFVFLTAVLFIFSACRIDDKPTTLVSKDVGIEYGFDYKLTLTTLSDTILSGNKTGIAAKLIKFKETDTSDVINATVNFSILGMPDGAKMEPSSVTTSTMGEAISDFSAVLPAGSESKAYLVVANYHSFADTIKIVVIPKLELNLTALNDTIFSENKVGITAKLTRIDGTDISNIKYAEILFSILSSPSNAKVEPTKNVTNEAGETFTLFSADLLQGAQRQSFFVIAYYGSFVSDTMEIVVTPKPEDAVHGRNLTLVASSFVITDGENVSEITATVFDNNGILIQGERVNFTTNSGFIRTGIQQPTTNANGQVKISLVGVPKGEQALVTAQLVSDPKITTSILVGLSGDMIILTAPNDTIFSGNKVGITAKLTKVDGSNTTNIKYAEVSFTILGNPSNAKLEPAKNVTNDIGETFSLFSADLLQGAQRQSFFVVANYNTTSDTIEIVVTPKPEDAVHGRNLTLVASSFVVAADGVSSSTITATVADAVTGSLIQGERVNFSTTSGNIKLTQPITDADGKAMISLVSVRRNEQAMITAQLVSDPKITESVLVDFTGVRLTLRKNKESIVPNGNDTVVVTALLLDAAANPVFNEAIVFKSFDENTFKITSKDATTNNRGEASVKLVGTGISKKIETLAATAAGTSDTITVNYSSKIIRIDTSGLNNKYLVSPKEASEPREITRLKITYLQSDGTTPIAGASISVSVDKGGIVRGTDTIPFISTTTNAQGEYTLTIINPSFSGDLSVNVSANSGDELTGITEVIYIKSRDLYRLMLEITPNTISTGGEEAQIIVTATDSSGNLCAGESVYFNMESGPSGSGYLSPSFAVTGKDGRAVVKFISGSTESDQNGVRIVASVGNLKSNTAVLTIANTIAKVSLTSNISSIVKGTATYSIQFAAIVSDINGNPVPDGTPVVFSARVIGWGIWSRAPNISGDGKTYSVGRTLRILPFEDYNFNAIRDKGEGSGTYPLYRGEQIAMSGLDMSFEPGPNFRDINGNGVRDYMFVMNNTILTNSGYESPEPWWTLSELKAPFSEISGLTKGVWALPSYTKNNGRTINTDDDVYFIDYNGNETLDISEPLTIPGTNTPNLSSNNDLVLSNYFTSTGTTVNGLGNYKDIDWNRNGRAEPNEKENAFVITRTLTTVGGIVNNTLTYGQNDGGRLCVETWVEVKGVVSNSEVFRPLPIAESDAVYFNPFRGKENLW